MNVFYFPSLIELKNIPVGDICTLKKHKKQEHFAEFVLFLFPQINFSDLAQRYGLDAKLGNMVVKEFLQSSGVDLNRFTTYRKNKNPLVRRG